jgi:hypothetical protein
LTTGLSSVDTYHLSRNHPESGGFTLKSFVIGALVVAVPILGYLYWDSRNNTVFKAPGIEIKKN